MTLDLFTPINAGYKSAKYQNQELGKYGYNRDNQLSSKNQQVYFNPSNNKLLVNVAGTHNLSDIGTDLYLGLGLLKQTNRRKQADQVLKQAKAKYGVNMATLTGHSLGSGITNSISKGGDKVFNSNSAYGINQKARANVKNYNVYGDPVSFFSPNKNSTNVSNNNNATGFAPLDGLFAHNTKNFKNKPIFID
jgi:hypothetical protein